MVAVEESRRKRRKAGEGGAYRFDALEELVQAAVGVAGEEDARRRRRGGGHWWVLFGHGAGGRGEEDTSRSESLGLALGHISWARLCSYWAENLDFSCARKYGREARLGTSRSVANLYYTSLSRVLHLHFQYPVAVNISICDMDVLKLRTRSIKRKSRVPPLPDL